MIVQTKYGYKVDLGDSTSDIYVENKEGKIIAAFTPMEILRLRNKIVEMIKKNQKKN
ncbi:MAG: hypothetical protein WCT22_03935 [Patescibacteria group bacterium]|jgi:hypothetical protein